MAFRCMFANLAVGVGTALKLENAQNAERKCFKKRENVRVGFLSERFPILECFLHVLDGFFLERFYFP